MAVSNANNSAIFEIFIKLQGFLFLEYYSMSRDPCNANKPKHHQNISDQCGINGTPISVMCQHYFRTLLKPKFA